ncbi:MAG: hypothetical protein ABI670_09060 [Chloroflexota bacterium]
MPAINIIEGIVVKNEMKFPGQYRILIIATGLLAVFAALIWYSVTLLLHHDINPDVTIHTPPEHASSLRVVTSDQYAIWEFGTGDIFGYDLRNKKEVPVSVGEPYAQEWADISGVSVVYESRNDETYVLPFDIVIKNLETGSTRKFPTGTSAYVYPKIYGSRITWSDGFILTLADLASGATEKIASVRANSAGSIQQVEISADYVVWTEAAYFNIYDTPRTSYIKAYDLRTGSVKSIVEFEVPGTGPYPEYALDGHRLAVNEPMRPNSYRVVDLDTGGDTSISWEARASSNIVAPILKGDLLAWSIYDGDPEGLNIWAVDLKAGGKAVPLMTGNGDQLPVGIVNDQLVWLSRDSDPLHSGFGFAPIGSLFASAPDRQKDLDK